MTSAGKGVSSLKDWDALREQAADLDPRETGVAVEPWGLAAASPYSATVFDAGVTSLEVTAGAIPPAPSSRGLTVRSPPSPPPDRYPAGWATYERRRESRGTHTSRDPSTYETTSVKTSLAGLPLDDPNAAISSANRFGHHQ